MSQREIKTEADSDAVVAEYRQAIEHLETCPPEAHAHWFQIAKLCREAWQRFTGEDSLHEHAFGEPDE
jgi:hypothetical protein